MLCILSLFVFFLIHLTPDGPARIMLGADASEAEVAELSERLGLNDPLFIQYLRWMAGALRGDLGTSYFRNGTVIAEIGKALEPTLSLAVWAQFAATLAAIPLGIYTARRKGKIQDSLVIGASLLGISIPSFLLSLLLAILFAVYLNWLPVAGYRPMRTFGMLSHLRYIALPVLALTLMQTSMLTRMTRVAMIDVIGSDYIRTAKAKGLKDTVILYKHALRNALIPILTTIGQTFATLLSGAAVVETVFGIPGVGQLIVGSVTRKDYPVIQGIVLVVGFIYICANFLIDMLYGIVDPRIRLAAGRMKG
jgi:peptide/nickel transport system permease protein